MSVITRALLTAVPALTTGFAALVATPASAQTPVNYYVAVPAAAPTSTRLITNGTPWRLENASFVSSKAPQRDVILCAAVAKRGYQVRIRDAVFLNRNPQTLQRQLAGATVEYRQNLSPRVWLRRCDPDRYLHLAQCRNRLGAAGDDPRASQCVNEAVATASNPLDRCDQSTRADAGQKNDEIELAPLEAVGKCHCLHVRLEWDLAH